MTWIVPIILLLLCWFYFIYSLKWVDWIFSNRSLFFSTQLHLKIPVFKFINLFLFHPTWAADVQARLDFLQLLYDFLASKNTFTSSVYIFPVVLLFAVNRWPNGYRTQFQSLCEESSWGSIPVLLLCSLLAWMPNTQVRLISSK